TLQRRAKKWLLYAGHLIGRLWDHVAVLPGVAASGVRWKWGVGGFSRSFWQFLVSAVLLNFALFIFVLLNNLRLLDMGLREDGLGVINSASTAGTMAGALPAAWVVRRFGLRATLITTIASCSVLVALRSVATTRVALVGLAGVWGL